MKDIKKKIEKVIHDAQDDYAANGMKHMPSQLIHTESILAMIKGYVQVPDGMPTAEAVKYIEHGREMVGIIRIAQSICQHGELVPSCEECNIGSCEKRDLLTKLEAK